MPLIEVDEEVLGLMKTEAEAFVDTPNSVLRRKYGLPETENGTTAAAGEAETAAEPADTTDSRRGRSRDRRVARRSRNSRAPRGSLLPHVEYEDPILTILHERGGEAPAREVVDALELILGDRFTELDRAETAKSGVVRWRNRAQFARLALVKRGLIDSKAPRGIWRLTEAGRQAAVTS